VPSCSPEKRIDRWRKRLPEPFRVPQRGVIPTTYALRRKGAGRGATVSFLISTPEKSVDSLAVTWALMGPVMALVRPLAALVTAAMAGLLETLRGEGPAVPRSQRIPFAP